MAMRIDFDEALRHLIREEVRAAVSEALDEHKPDPAPALRAEQAWFTSAQAAAHLGVSAKTLANWRGLGKGPKFEKLDGERVRYAREVLEAWMRTHGK